MARITCEDCLDKVGNQNRFNLIHLAVKRIKQHRQGEPFLADGKNKEIVMTLREIAAGKVNFTNVDKLPDQYDTPDKTDEDLSEKTTAIS
ncbi:DNA-directed RNA polymerase subunit omega [Desulforhopalus singaporensis]|uniref:DNA-directed RNA polymerase subunit omega n=1 Tax=Desulforhopalus singaporensis TaxID=91360 RepID=A0A1H0QNK2_9BACT|nr:DNA-directed RNA polymerase subunit omega [Desulforhopalus singaporensis]SDP18927.1 DNA-directed RNA polymerase subunit omega [Desulforhopalus singaporensis]